MELGLELKVFRLSKKQTTYHIILVPYNWPDHRGKLIHQSLWYLSQFFPPVFRSRSHQDCPWLSPACLPVVRSLCLLVVPMDALFAPVTISCWCKNERRNEYRHCKTSWYTHFFYRQLDFQSEPGSCLAICENGLETEPTLPAKTCLNDSSWSEHSFPTKISKRNQLF